MSMKFNQCIQNLKWGVLGFCILSACSSNPHKAKNIETEMEKKDVVSGDTSVGVKDGNMIVQKKVMMNEELRRMTMRDPSTSVLTDIARKFGMQTLREDGIQKVLQGTTTISEVLYATKKDTDER